MESDRAAPVHLNAELCDFLSVAPEQIENVAGGRGGWLLLNLVRAPIEGSFGGRESKVNRGWTYPSGIYLSTPICRSIGPCFCSYVLCRVALRQGRPADLGDHRLGRSRRPPFIAILRVVAGWRFLCAPQRSAARLAGVCLQNELFTGRRDSGHLLKRALIEF